MRYFASRNYQWFFVDPLRRKERRRKLLKCGERSSEMMMMTTAATTTTTTKTLAERSRSSNGTEGTKKGTGERVERRG